MPNSKKKGNAGENKFANWLRGFNLNASRNRGSGSGVMKSDVHNDLGFNFEVKTVKRLSLQEAWKQSEKDAFDTRTIPTVVVHFDGMPEDTWLIVMNNHDWMDMYKKSLEPKLITDDNREQKYALTGLREAIKKVEKFLK